MDFSLKDLRAFAVRNRLDVIFHVCSSDAAWMVSRRGLVARPPLGNSSVAGVEETLESADEFLVEGAKEPRKRLTRDQLIEWMAARATAANSGKDKDDE